MSQGYTGMGGSLLSSFPPPLSLCVYVPVVCMHTYSFTHMWANVHVGVHAYMCIWRSDVGIRCLLW